MEKTNYEQITEEELNNLSFEELAFYLQTLNLVKDYYDEVGEDDE